MRAEQVLKKILIIGKKSYIARSFITYVTRENLQYSIDTISVRDDSWENISFKEYDTVIHTAALVHESTRGATVELYDNVNYKLTFKLAKKAKKDNVKHFVFLSTMSVYGLTTGHITASTPLEPITPYGKSKAKAENALRFLSSEDFTVTIIRPPMVYGPNCKGNFRTLTKFASISPIFPKVNNTRSAIFIDNLSKFIKIVIDNKIEGTLFPQNEEYLNTSKVVFLLAKATSKNLYLFNLTGLGSKLLKLTPKAQKAFGNLTYDTSLPGGPDTLEYNIVNFDKSIEISAQPFRSRNNQRTSLVDQRPFDIAISITGLIATSPLLLAISLAGYFDTGSPLFIQERVGKGKKPFKLIKFRTMSLDTSSVASHLADNSSITKLGRILRKTKLDELPQLINVLKGEMSLVGPRPNLFNQEELIEARDNKGIYDVLPGITGLAQLSGIDMSTPELLANTDKEMIENLTLRKYFSYIIYTALGKGSGDAVIPSTT